MDKDFLKRKVLSDMNMKENMIADLQRELQEEMDKPSAKWDCKKIAEITNTIHHLSCSEETEISKTGKEALLKKLKNNSVPKRRIYKRISTVAACLCIFLGLNFFSISVLGMNIFSAAYQVTTGGISIDLKKKEPILLPASSGDPYGMKAKCAEFNMYPLTPSYIPKKFELIDIAEIQSHSFNNIVFYYKRSGIKLNFDICQYNEGEEIPPIGIPTDTYNITEEYINGYKMYILKEDNQFTAAFIDGNIVYMVCADGLDYDTCYKVIESLAK